MPTVQVATRPLSDKQIQFLKHYAVSQDRQSAGKSVGWSDKSIPQMAKRTLQCKRGQEYLKRLQADSRAIIAYDLALAMQESLEVIAFAKEKGNAMAYFKAVEHRAKLSGLLVDRVQVSTVDIRAALQEAESRIMNITPQHIDIPQSITSHNMQLIDNTESTS